MLLTLLSRLFGLFFPIIVFFAAPCPGSRELTPVIALAMSFMFSLSFLMEYHMKKNDLDIFLVTNYLFFYLSSGVAVIVMELQKIRLKLDWAFPLHNLMLALFCSIISLIIIEFVYSKKIQDSNLRPKSDYFLIPNSLLTKISLISVVLSSVYFTLIPVSSLFNSRALATDTLNSTFATDSGQAAIGILVAVTKITPMCLGIYVILVRKNRKERLRILDLLAIFPSLIAFNPISSARYIFVLFIVTLGCVLFEIPTNKFAAIFVYGGVALAILVFPNLDFSRYEKNAFRLSGVTESFNQIANKDFDQVAMGALVLQEVSNEIAPIGRQFLGELGFWIPRKYWESKPRDTSIILAKALGLSNSNLSIPLWAEGWSSFRYFGLFLYPWLLGFFGARMREGGNSNLGIKAMYFFFSGSVFILQRGPLLQATGIIAFGLATFSILSKIENYCRENQ